MAETQTAPGYKARLAFGEQGTSGAFDGADATAGVLLEIVDEDFKPDIRTNYLPGAVGHISQSSIRRRLGTKGGTGTLRVGCVYDQLDELLKAIMGKVSSGTYSFDKTVELPCNTVFVDKDFGGSGDTFKLNNARVQRAVFSSSQDDPHFMLALSLLGSTLAGGATFPSSGFSAPTGLIPQHYECTLSMGGVAQKPKSVEVTIDHQLVEDVYRNSRDRLAIPRGRRLVTGVVELDWNALSKALVDLWLADTAFTFQWQFTIGANTITFNSASNGCKFDGDVPNISAENFANTVRLPFTFYSVAAGGDDELTVVLA